MVTGKTQEPWTEQVSARLKAARSSLWAIERDARRYGGQEPPPYEAGAARLRELLAGARTLYAEVVCQHREFLACFPDLDQKAWLRLWEQVIEPYRLWQAKRQATQLLGSMGALQQTIREASRALAELDRMPLVAAARCRQMAQTCTQIAGQAAELGRAGVHGAALDAAVDEAHELDDRLHRLPAHFFGPQAAVLSQATKEDTVQAWQELGQMEGPLEAMAAALARWQGQWQAICSLLEALPAAAERAAAQLARIPDRVDTSDLEGELARARARATSLGTLPRPVDVGDLGSLGLHIAGATQALNGLGGRCAEICRQVDRLEETLARATDTLRGVQQRMNEAAEARPYPLDWGRQRSMREKLAEIHTGLKDRVQRAPERLEEDADQARGLLASLEALAGEVDGACQQRQAFVALVPRPELQLTSDWLEEAQALHNEANVYAAGNWPARLGVASLGVDAGALYRERQRLVPADPGEKLPAEEMGERVAQLQQLIGRIGGFERRLEEVARLLADLRRAEQEALARLDPACEALGPLLTALQNAYPPLDARLARYRYLLDDLIKDGDRVRADFADRGTGTVQEKVKRLETWAKAGMRTLVKELLPELTTLVARLSGELQSLVSDLQGLAPLDRTAPMEEARRLLDAEKPSPPRGIGPVPRLRLDDIPSAAGEAGRLLGKRGPFLLAIDALESKVAGPLRRPREAWQAARQEAQQRQEQILALKASVESGWPPLACDVTRAEDWLRQAGAEEGHLQRKGRWVADTIDILDKATRYYKAALADMEARQRETDVQHRDLVELARRIERWRAALVAYEQRQRHNPAVAQAVEATIVQIDREVSPLRQQWQRRPPAYREAKGALERAWSTVYRDVQPAGSSQAIRRRVIERGG